MTPLTLDMIRLATGAALNAADPAALIRSICTDTRKIHPGCLFIAIKGENHDGHDHLEAALKGVAVAAPVHRPIASALPSLTVPDTRRAMGQIATLVRSLLNGKVIAVAGSNGKTGTKNLIDSVLRHTRAGSISPKSFNNDIGVPTTIFDADPQHDYLVLEIGTNHPGEILNLTNIARPDIAVITNIGAEHLEFLGDLDGVRIENAQIIAGLNPDGLLIFNGDSPGLANAVASYPGKKITFGFHPDNDLHPTDIRCQADGVYFKLKNQPIFIPLMGRHTAVNALAAIAVARHLGVGDADIIAGLSTATGPEMRLQLQTAGGISILNDAYNANPHSMQAALETLRDMETTGRKIAILGDMRQLGRTAEHYHEQIGRFAAGCGLDQLICVGTNAKQIANGAIAAGFPVEQIEQFDRATDCAAAIAGLIAQDDLILLKASRGMKLETIATAIQTTVTTAGLRRRIAARTGVLLPRSRAAQRTSPVSAS